GYYAAGQLGPGLTGDVRQVAVDIAVADTSTEVLIAVGSALDGLQFGAQPAIGGVGWAVREGYPGQGIQVAQAGTRQAQVQVQCAQVLRIGQGASETDAGGASADIRLQW